MQGVQGGTLHPLKKANWTKIKKKDRKKSQNQENLSKLSQCRLQMGLKWGVFKGITPSPPIFSKSAPPKN